MKIGILYICVGKYEIFWDDFYSSCEKYFLKEDIKHYFIFTDSPKILNINMSNCTTIYQEKLLWPYITLYRYKFFESILDQLSQMDYIFFFNANLRFNSLIDQEFLPSKKQPFTFVIHPGYYKKSKDFFPYEKNIDSTAYLSADNAKYYIMGGVNGGLSAEYIDLIKQLNRNIKLDEDNKIIAEWHDESHLNKFAHDNLSRSNILSPKYGYPEGWDLPFEKKIIILDKNKFGGHKFLRGQQLSFKEKLKLCLKKK